MLSAQEIEEIRARYAHYGETKNLHANTAVKDVRQLLELIDRLRTMGLWWTV